VREAVGKGPQGLYKALKGLMRPSRALQDMKTHQEPVWQRAGLAKHRISKKNKNIKTYHFLKILKIHKRNIQKY